MIKKILLGTGLVLGSMFAFWYAFIALKPQPMPQNEILAAYEHKAGTHKRTESLNFSLELLDERNFGFTVESFDGQLVTGQIAYPENQAETMPVLLGIPAMGRSYIRWFEASFKGRPTVTHVNLITEAALEKGYAVISIDPRYHGKRKDPDRTLRSIMARMNFLGDKSDYQAMIRDTVMDYRVLLDWVEAQSQFSSGDITVVGYSMGGQISLLLSAVDDRIDSIISIVPPFVGDKVALVAPVNLVDKLHHQRILLITAEDDENSSAEQNEHLFQKIASAEKKQIVFEGGHILPRKYVSDVALWLQPE